MRGRTVRRIAEVGSIDEPLGRLFRAGHGEQSLPLGGATIEVGAPANDKGERIALSGSQAMRLMVFCKHSRSWTLYAYGEQLSAGKPHGGDQLELFRRREFKPALFDLVELTPQIRSTTTLTFQSRP